MYVYVDRYFRNLDIYRGVEATFNTSGHILDPYRTNLSTNIIVVLVCTRDWVRKSIKSIVNNIYDVLKDDEVVKELKDTINKRDGKGK